jgi:hypothetical protein
MDPISLGILAFCGKKLVDYITDDGPKKLKEPERKELSLPPQNTMNDLKSHAKQVLYGNQPMPDDEILINARESEVISGSTRFLKQHMEVVTPRGNYEMSREILPRDHYNRILTGPQDVGVCASCGSDMHVKSLHKCDWKCGKWYCEDCMEFFPNSGYYVCFKCYRHLDEITPY